MDLEMHGSVEQPKLRSGQKPLARKWKVRCIAHRKNGQQCKKWAMHGQAVCGSHGGRASQNLAKAQQRIAMLADAMVQRMDELSKAARSEQVRFLATKDLLDRTGVGTKQELEVTLKPWEAAIEGILVDDDGPDVVEGEVVENVAEWDDEKPVSIMDDPPAHRRPGPRLKP